MSFATQEGTFAYAKRFPKFSKDFFTPVNELFVSSIGIGSFRPEPYKEENYVFSIKDVITAAVESGANLIDTAINYRYQMSEREIGEALKELFEKGYGREELILASKAGFIPLDFPFPKDPYAWIDEEMIQKGLCTKEEVIIDQHCISPKFLEWSLEQSLKNLGVDTLDIFFLHNPEMQLGHVPYETVLERIEAAFELFERKVAEGKIKAYGVASWNAFLYEPENMEYLSLLDVVKIAQKVGGENHHFKYLELPYNLAKTDAYSYTNQKAPDERFYTTLQVARGFGIATIASSPLLQMNLFKRPFSKQVTDLLGLKEMTDIHNALQFSRSAPGIIGTVFGAIFADHVQENMLLAHFPKVPVENYQNIFGF